MNHRGLARCQFQPTLFVGLGGFGNEMLLVLRAYLYLCLGFLPECFRWLGIDFASDPPQPPVVAFAGEVAPDVWEAVALRDGEQCLLSLGDNPAELAAQIRAGDDGVAWVGNIVSPDLLENYQGSEASQVPAIARATLARCAHDPDLAGGVSWVEQVDAALTDLGRGGEGVRDFLLGHELPQGCWKPTPVRMVLLAGAQGGTGGGTLLSLATVARWLSRQAGPRLMIEAQIVAGAYRPKDGQEHRKSQLNRALDMDIEHAAACRGAVFSMPLGPALIAQARGTLLDTVYRLEAWGALRHNGPAVLAQAGQMLLRRHLSRAAIERRRSQGNVRMLPALVKK